MNAFAPPIQIEDIDHIQLDVANIEESLEFYKRVFDFEVKEVGLRASVRWMIIGTKSRLYLCMHEYAAGKGIENNGLKITHFGIIVDKFDGVLKGLIEHNVTLFLDYHVQYHSSRSVYFLDPNGYKIEISEKNGGGIE